VGLKFAVGGSDMPPCGMMQRLGWLLRADRLLARPAAHNSQSHWLRKGTTGSLLKENKRSHLGRKHPPPSPLHPQTKLITGLCLNTTHIPDSDRSSGGLQGKIKSLEQIYLFSMPVKEYQIVENFLGAALKDEVMKIMPVQKQTRAGQRTRFKVRS